MPKYELSQIVELTKDMPEIGLARGTRAAVVQVFEEPDEAYEIEVVDESGDTRAELAVSPDQIRPVRSLVLKTFSETNLKTGETLTASTAAAGICPLDRRPGNAQNAGRFDLGLAGGEHPASFGKP